MAITTRRCSPEAMDRRPSATRSLLSEQGRTRTSPTSDGAWTTSSFQCIDAVSASGGQTLSRDLVTALDHDCYPDAPCIPSRGLAQDTTDDPVARVTGRIGLVVVDLGV